MANKPKYAEFAIKYDSYPLLLEDLDGPIAEWVNRWLPLAYANLFTLPNTAVSPRHEFNPIGGPVHLGIQRPNWNPLPPPKINTLIWPTGASRWAYGVFLVDGETLKNLTADNNGTEGLKLQIEYAGDIALTARMWMLPAQPLSNAAGQPQDAITAGQPQDAITKGRNQRPKNHGNIYLLPLVDIRYFWQFIGSENYDADSHFSWNDLSTAVCGKLTGSNKDFSIDVAEYFKPDPDQMMLVQNSNAALHLDAIASSTGGQIVVFPSYNSGGTYATVNLARWQDYPRPNADDTRSTTALDPVDTSPLCAGLHYSDDLASSGIVYPETFRVVHRKWMYGRAKRAIYAKEYDTVTEFGNDESQIIPNLVHTIYTTAFCNVNKFEGVGVVDPPVDPDNIDDIDDLSLQLVTDAYHRWVWMPAVHVVAGVYPIRYLNEQASGQLQHLAQADRVEFHLGVRDPIDGQWKCFTRWVGLPHNFGPTTNLCQFPDTPVFYSPNEFTIDSDYPLDGPDFADDDGCNASFNHTPNNGLETPIGDELRVKVNPPFNSMTGSGTAQAYWNDSTETWIVLQKGCS